MNTQVVKAKDRESGTSTATLLSGETTTMSLTPVPAKAPGIIVLRAGTAEEEHIYYKTRNSGAGTIGALTRDYSNLNGGVGREHQSGSAWETNMTADHLNNIVDALLEGYTREQSTSVLYVSTSSFTVNGDVTSYYTRGRIVRYNEDNTKIGIVFSSSYSSGTGLTTVTTNYGTVPNPITALELGLMPSNATNFYALTSAIQSGSYLYGTDSGGSDSYAVTFDPALTAYTNGQYLLFKANTVNTGVATLNANGLGAITIKKNKDQDLEDGDIKAGQIILVTYNSVTGFFEMLNQLGNLPAVGLKPYDGWTHNIKIVPTVTSNALTLAVKGKDGNDLSTTNPGYAFLGGAMRTITGALSLTIAQGTTRVFGLGTAAGAPEFTGKEVDWFSHLIWDGTAVRLGMSRSIQGRKYSLYSSTSTDEKYMAISGGTPAGTSPVCVIGRFAATVTFSTPNYNWSVPTYDDDNIVQGYVESTRLLDWAPVRTVSGGTVPTFTGRDSNKYRVVGKRCFFEQSWDNSAGGTAGAGANPFLYTLPFSPTNYLSSNRYTIGHGTIFATANSLADCLLNTANQVNIWMGGAGVATGASFAAVTRAWWCNGNFEI